MAADDSNFIAKVLGVSHQTIQRDFRGRVTKGDKTVTNGDKPLRGPEGIGENEWDTPKEIIALARQVLGTIDFDPASSKRAQRVAQANSYLTKRNDRLKQSWRGKVWLNPLYA